ncbi:glycosyltransferase [Nocardia cyriacigeorgica]|uniref:glycosyltransferase n=1 Tax=Nocardia cyriacigeorgica TaxID=135487 RepID=UPI0013D7E605|nr:glycosyltransferase [Nocardia cyriacigeorgica]NEW26057.1 glycosyltransferase family 1 protein [Nocardia cyriacigeorgica]
MKIAMVSEHASPLAALGGVDAGGQNVHVGALASAFARDGHEVSVFTRRDDPRIDTEVVTGDGYRVIHVPAGPRTPIPKDAILPHLGDFADFLYESWSSDSPDVVHAHFWMSGLATELAARRLHLPVVLTFHALGTVKRRYQGRADTSPRARIKFERLIAVSADHIVATCSDEVRELARMGVPDARTSVVPCGVDLSMFDRHGPIAPKGRRRRLLSIGRMVPRKGFDTAIKALPELPDTELLIAGGGADDTARAEAARLRRIATEHGVADRVQLLGQLAHAEMPALLRSADVVVCTPWYEPFGIVPLEAMACAKPVVASAVGGLLDTVDDGVTGALVPPSEPKPLARALRSLLADSAQRRRWGAAGHRKVCGRYSWDQIAADTLTAYEKATSAQAAALGAAS